MKKFILKKIFLSSLTFLISLGMFAFVVNHVNAADSAMGLKGAAENIKETAKGSGYDTDQTEIEPIIGTIIKSLLSFLGVIFFILTLYGGFLWMTSRGNSDQVSKAKDIIITAIVGLVVLLFAYAITYFVIDAITSATGYGK